jgi:DNA ligase-1
MSEKSSVWSDEEPIEKENNKNKLKNKKMSKTPADKGKKRVQKEEEKKDTGKTGSGSIEVMLA